MLLRFGWRYTTALHNLQAKIICDKNWYFIVIVVVEAHSLVLLQILLSPSVHCNFQLVLLVQDCNKIIILGLHFRIAFSHVFNVRLRLSITVFLCWLHLQLTFFSTGLEHTCSY